ncbi:unnamed protein product [Gordionus sp. m RMFG-2023]
MIPGDGVGPDLMQSVKDVFKSIGAPIHFEEMQVSEINPSMSVPFDDVIQSIFRNGVALKGNIRSSQGMFLDDIQTLNMQMRRALDLFANVVWISSIPGLKTRHDDLDFIIIREQTESEYSALEHESVPGVVESMKIITRFKSERIAKFAFDFAVKYGRKKVTAVHKANIMKLGDGLFLNCCREIAKLYPSIKFTDTIVDNCCMQLVWNPWQFDVMVMPNLYGNIVDNLAAGLVGGAGVVPGQSHSNHCAVFETGARHPFAEAVGKHIANPTAMLWSASNMLGYLELPKHQKWVKDALFKVQKNLPML